MNERREFLKKTTLAISALVTFPITSKYSAEARESPFNFKELNLLEDFIPVLNPLFFSQEKFEENQQNLKIELKFTKDLNMVIEKQG